VAKDRIIKIRLEEEEYDCYKMVADGQNTTMSDFIREAVWEKMTYNNVQQLLDKVQMEDGSHDPSQLTEFQFHYLNERYKDLTQLFNKEEWTYYTGDFADTKRKKIITLENFDIEDK